MQNLNHLAQIENPILRPSIRNLSGVEFFENLVPRLITMALIIGSVVFVFMLLTGAIQWITSGGDKSNVEAARGRVIHAVIGLVIMFSVFAIAALAEGFFGIDILTLDIQSLTIQ